MLVMMVQCLCCFTGSH